MSGEVGGPGTGQQEPHAIVVHEPVAVGAAVAGTDLVQLAIEKNLDIEKLERLIALRNQEADRRAVGEFAAAMAQFQKRCPAITRGKLVDYVTKTGIRIKYRHAELRDIQEEIKDICSDLGLSYSWDNVVEAGNLRCTCTVWHVAGHSRSASFVCPIANANPGMSDQQKYGGALTFAERYSLIQALGLVTADPDEDGEANVGDTEAVTEQQAHDLEMKAEELKVGKAEFLKFLGVDSFAAIRAADFPRAVNALKERERTLARKKGSA